MGKKGVSAQEKKDRMLAMFHRNCEVFTSKEVTKSASKEGIVSGAIEGVLKELVSDDLVHEEKISGSLFYWSFPGEMAMKKRAELAASHADLERQQRQIHDLQEQAEQMRKAQGQTQSEAQELKAQELLLVEVRAREAERKAEIEQLRKAAGQNMHMRKRDLGVLRDAANRWTDNLYELKKHCVENCGVEPKTVDEMLGTDKIDYLE